MQCNAFSLYSLAISLCLSCMLWCAVSVSTSLRCCYYCCCCFIGKFWTARPNHYTMKLPTQHFLGIPRDQN
ncbi:hypothetical protein F5Y08DRAFT_293114 [Xylaria arbuscula]|nr:hypothetical protein F5Y08DRAFT_293114 [Xylaria arbuscula]